MNINNRFEPGDMVYVINAIEDYKRSKTGKALEYKKQMVASDILFYIQFILVYNEYIYFYGRFDYEIFQYPPEHCFATEEEREAYIQEYNSNQEWIKI